MAQPTPDQTRQLLSAITNDLNQQDPRDIARANGWETIGEIPEGWTREPQRIAPVTNTGLNWNPQQQQVTQLPPEMQQIAAENQELRQRLADMESARATIDMDTAAEKAVREMKLPDGFKEMTPEQQERERAKALMAALRPMLGNTKVPTAPEGVTERLEELELRQRLGPLTQEQIAALKGIAKTRKPANDQELLALARIAHPALFAAGGQATGFVAPPGREMPVRSGRPQFSELAGAIRENKKNRSVRDKLGAAALRAFAEENPRLFTRGI